MSITTGKTGTVLGGSFLIAAWCISNTFLGLPIASGSSGFFPGLCINLIVLLLLTIPSALLYTEAILALTDGDNIISLCKKLVGPITAILITILFLFLHFSWLPYYFHDMLPVISFFLTPLFSSSLLTSGIIFTSFLVLIVFCGLKATSRLTYILFVALLLSTLWLAFSLFHKISPSYLLRNEWAFAFLAIPTYVGFYYYQSILPTLSTYLNRDAFRIRKAILLASIIILLFNTIWQLLILGIIPESLLWKAAGALGDTQQGLVLFRGSIVLSNLYHFILFFSITTSMLLEGCILVDVLSDGFHIPLIKRTGIKRFMFCLLIFVPTVLLSQFEWVLAEDLLSGWGELILTGPLPALLVWQVRYTHKISAPQILPGGRATLLLFTLLSFLLFYIQGASLLWSSTI